MKSIEKLDREMDVFFKDFENAVVTHPSDGALAIVNVGTENDVITTVRIASTTRFNGSYSVCFGVHEDLPSSLANKVSELSFEGIDGAYDYIVGLSEKINSFFNTL